MRARFTVSGGFHSPREGETPRPLQRKSCIYLRWVERTNIVYRKPAKRVSNYMARVINAVARVSGLRITLWNVERRSGFRVKGKNSLRAGYDSALLRATIHVIDRREMAMWLVCVSKSSRVSRLLQDARVWLLAEKKKRKINVRCNPLRARDREMSWSGRRLSS